MKPLTFPSLGLIVDGEGLVYFTKQGHELLEEMLQDYKKKKQSRHHSSTVSTK